MTFPELIRATHDALKPLVEAAGGSIRVAESLEQAQTFLNAAPNKWRLILHWEGFGSHPQARLGMTTHQVATVIQQPRGLVKNPGEHITHPLPSGAVAFSERIEQVLSWMAAMRFPDGTHADDAGYVVESSQWLTSAAGTQAHVINWSLAAALTHYETTIPLTFSKPTHLP